MLDKVFVRKKMAQIMALTFVQDYPVKVKRDICFH